MHIDYSIAFYNQLLSEIYNAYDINVYTAYISILQVTTNTLWIRIKIYRNKIRDIIYKFMVYNNSTLQILNIVLYIFIILYYGYLYIWGLMLNWCSV